jgi:carboxylesterase type B
MQLSTWLASIATLAQIAYSQSVTITNGTVTGTNDAVNNVQRFLGIPYAQPPVGNLRLQQSIPLNSSFGTLNATTFGPACYGKSNPNPSEDCLTLNVWRPSDASNKGLLPVLVWFYGGGLTGGYTVS